MVRLGGGAWSLNNIAFKFIRNVHKINISSLLLIQAHLGLVEVVARSRVEGLWSSVSWPEHAFLNSSEFRRDSGPLFL